MEDPDHSDLIASCEDEDYANLLDAEWADEALADPEDEDIDNEGCGTGSDRYPRVYV